MVEDLLELRDGFRVSMRGGERLVTEIRGSSPDSPRTPR